MRVSEIQKQGKLKIGKQTFSGIKKKKSQDRNTGIFIEQESDRPVKSCFHRCCHVSTVQLLNFLRLNCGML